MTGFLSRMAITSRQRVEAARAIEPPATLVARARAAPPAPALRPSGAGFDLFAEVKLRAPSKGVLATPTDPPAEAAGRALAYARAGAAAVSVLTEPTRFDGDLSHLAAAAGVCPVPVMRKDFLVDPYQVWEARAAGAGGVLLIARMLDDGALRAMLDAAAEAGLFALVEAFDAEDLERIGAIEASVPLLVGVNCRDLATLAIEPRRLSSLAGHLPAGRVAVAESGVATAEDARTVARAGYRVALVGTALMVSADPGALVATLLAAGRSARAEATWASS